MVTKTEFDRKPQLKRIPAVVVPILWHVWGQARWESESESHSVVSNSFWPHGLYSPWNSPGQNTRVGSLSILQGIFLTQGLKPGLPHCRQTLYQLCHKGSPRILEWVTYLFPSGSSRPRNRTRVSCIAGGFFTNWGKNYLSITLKNSLGKSYIANA